MGMFSTSTCKGVIPKGSLFSFWEIEAALHTLCPVCPRQIWAVEREKRRRKIFRVQSVPGADFPRFFRLKKMWTQKKRGNNANTTMGGVKTYETERAKGRGDYVKEYKTKKRSNGENNHFSEKRRSMDLPLFLLDISTKQDKKIAF